MNIIQRINMRVYALFAVSLGVAVIAGFAGVKAYQGIAPDIVLESGATLNYQEAPAPTPTEAVEEELGAFQTPCESFNGLEVCSYAEGFNEATTTIFSLKNPFNATSTVDYFAMEGHTGSSLINIYVGTSTVSSIPIKTTTSVPGSDISATLVNATSVATSSKFYIKNGQNVANGSGQVAAGGTSLNAIIVGPSEWVVGYASGTVAVGGPGYNVDNSSSVASSSISGTGNTFFGNYGLRFVKHQTPQDD